MVRTYLTKKGVGPAVEVPLLGTGLLAGSITEGINYLVSIHQVLKPKKKCPILVRTKNRLQYLNGLAYILLSHFGK